MKIMDVRSRIYLTAGLVFMVLGVLLVSQVQSLGRLRLIFCDVGQGDGILIITPGGKQILVDGGPGKKISECLSSKMPFWDRNIELMIPTHPQQDHIEGQIDVFEKYHVGQVLYTGVENKAQFFEQWKNDLKKEGSGVITAKRGDRIDAGNVSLEILWPSAEVEEDWKQKEPADLNQSSIVLRLSWGSFCAYFTGDITREILDGLVDKQCQVFKVAHHGSKTGTDEEIIAKIAPKIAVIQVGKNNRYGHPTQEVLDLLTERGVKILRNDLLGNVEIDIDGKTFWQVRD